MSAPSETAEKRYNTLTVVGLTDAAAEIVSAEMFDLGAAGVQEDLPFQQEGEFYEPTQLKRDTVTLIIYFEAAIPAAALRYLQEHHPEARAQADSHDVKDWLAEWKKGFEAFELVNGIYVVPSWREVPAAARAAIKIDPGMAFGTGTHETTRLAATLLPPAPHADAGFFDVGTGTGILAFLAEHLGYKNILGIEIDDDARRTARENVALNTSRVRIEDLRCEQVTETFDVVVANIIDGVLIQLQESLRRAVNPGGHLLLTGILDERDAQFRERFSFEGFQLLRRETNGEWVGYLLQRKGQGA